MATVVPNSTFRSSRDGCRCRDCSLARLSQAAEAGVAEALGLQVDAVDVGRTDHDARVPVAVHQVVGVAQFVDGLLAQTLEQQFAVGRQTVDLVVQAVGRNHGRRAVQLGFAEHVGQDGNEQIHAGDAQDPRRAARAAGSAVGPAGCGSCTGRGGVEGQFRIERGRMLLDPQAEDARQLRGQRRQQVAIVAAVDRYQMQHAHGVCSQDHGSESAAGQVRRPYFLILL